MIVSIDFETRSTLDLRKTGVYTYALGDHTDLWVMCYAVDYGPILRWYPGDPVPECFLDPDAVTEYRAWNAEFERVIYAAIMVPRYGFPAVPLVKWYDTAAQAAAMALPRALGAAAEVLGIGVQKDQDGRRLMLQMSKPRRFENGEPVWWDQPEKVERLSQYCTTDVEVERAIAAVLPPLNKKERVVYLVDQRANTRGVLVDLELVRAAQDVLDKEMASVEARLTDLTGGAVTKVTDVVGMKSWLSAWPHELELPDLRKDTVRDLLEELPPGPARDVLQIRQDAGKTSTAKLQRFLDAAGPDGRVRGGFLYHGASTGRWAGRGIQPQNFPRPEYKDVNRYIDRFLDKHPDPTDGEPPALVVSSLLRSMLIAGPRKIFRSGDYSQIEARVLAWLSGQDDLVKLFAEGGKVYEEMAAFIFNKPVAEIGKDSFERQIGKNSILGAGFQMGPTRFQEQVKEQTGIDIPDELAEKAIYAYRDKNYCIAGFWNHIYDAAFTATVYPGTEAGAGRVMFVRKGDILWCRLPSGRRLAYSLPMIEEKETPWGEMRPTLTFCAVTGPARKWQRVTTYGGHLTENVVQAIARDCMAEAWLHLEAAGYPVIMTVHDELVTEPNAGHGSQEEFESILAARPSWAPDLPIAVEGWEGFRYRK